MNLVGMLEYVFIHVIMSKYRAKLLFGYIIFN